MKTMLAFMKKEFKAHLRTGKILVMGILAVVFGIMNPGIAYVTPILLESMSDILAESGMVIPAVSVSAVDSWVQFYKNMPIALIVFVVMESGIFAGEYRTGTLILALTKGLDRYKAVVSKIVVPAAIWTAAYWLCFVITYLFNAVLWDNAAAQNLMFSGICWWLFGLWILSLMILFSVIGKSNTLAMLGTGGVYAALMLLGMFRKIAGYLPTMLSDGTSLVYGMEKAGAYTAPALIAVFTLIAFFALSIPVFNRKQL